MNSADLNSTRRSVLLEISDRRPGFSCQGKIGDFLDDYLVAESILRRLINYYTTDTNRNASGNLQTAQINAAINHFKITIKPSDITDAFQGGTGKRGFKSARQLRNGFLHDLNPDDQKEIVSKSENIKTLLNRIISPLLAAAAEAQSK